MPGEDAAYPGLDLYPQDAEAHRALLGWTQRAFSAADSGRTDHYNKWRKWYAMYRSFIARKEGQWRSSVFVPYVFSIVETIAPKLIAQLPGFVVNPVGPEDVLPAKNVETMMNYAATNSRPRLYVELVKVYKSALKYGTGIGKTYHQRDTKATVRMVPQLRDIPGPPTMVPDPLNPGQPMRDASGQLLTQPTGSLGQEPTGQLEPQRKEFVIYEGPALQWIDLFNFWVAPESQDIETARYVIHRTYQEMSHVMQRVEEGIYHLPPEMSPEDIASVEDEPLRVRQDILGLGDTSDSTRKPVEILEFWTDDGRVITMANRKALLRVSLNPFDHQQKPFVRIVDYLLEGEFYGVGEVEAIEGLQDLSNALVNQRLDNVRLLLNAMFAVNIEGIQDPRELEMRPGGVITVTGDRSPADVIHRIDLGDVTPSAFAETQQTEQLIERVSGVTPYTAGIDSPQYNQTATGIGLIQEAGNSKFAMKMNLAEMMGLKELASQWGSLIQQFTDEPKWIRMLGPEGAWTFEQIKPDSIVGALDFDIETASSAQTESVRKEQAMTLAQVVAGLFPPAAPQLVEDLLTAFGKKNIDAYMGPEAMQRALMIAMMQSMSRQQGAGPGGPMPQQGGPTQPNGQAMIGAPNGGVPQPPQASQPQGAP